MHRFDFNQQPLQLPKFMCDKTGLSDFHKMTVTVMKTSYQKLKPRIINYKDYKNFCNDTFWQVLSDKLAAGNINANCSVLRNFYKFGLIYLEMSAPCKKKYARGIINWQISHQFLKKSLKVQKTIIALWAFFQSFLKHLKSFFVNKLHFS